MGQSLYINKCIHAPKFFYTRIPGKIDGRGMLSICIFINLKVVNYIYFIIELNYYYYYYY